MSVVGRRGRVLMLCPPAVRSRLPWDLPPSLRAADEGGQFPRPYKFSRSQRPTRPSQPLGCVSISGARAGASACCCTA